MIKKVAIIVALILAIGAFAGCTSPTTNPSTSTSPIATELNATLVPATTEARHNVTISGRLTAGATYLTGQTITLYSWNGTAHATTGENVVTNGTGWYKFSQNEPASGTHYYRTAYAGSAVYSSATSNAVNATVTKITTTLSLTATPTTVKVNQNFVLAGRLTAHGNGVAHQTVHFYSWNGLTWADTDATAKTNARGFYSLSGHEPNVAKYQFLTKFLGSPTYAPSPAVNSAKVVVKQG